MRALIKKSLFDFLFWSVNMLIFFSAIYRTQEPDHYFFVALTAGAISVLPSIIPVYLHWYVFRRFLINKKFLHYGILTSIIIIASSIISAEFILAFVYTEEGTQVNTYPAIIFNCIIYTGIKYFIVGYQNESELQKAKASLLELEAKQSKVELELLKNQISPHFLFNTLNNIYSLALEQSKYTADAILKLSEMMRYILVNSKSSQVALKNECNFIENYLELQKLKHGSYCKIDYRIQIPENKISITPLLLIPFIENSFKHGVSANYSKNFVEIDLEATEEILTFMIKNSLTPKPNTLNHSTYTGIENVRKRLLLLYPERHQLDISQTDNSFTINLNLELQ